MEKPSIYCLKMTDIRYKHQLQYTVLLQESAQALQAVVPDQETPIKKTMHRQYLHHGRQV